ncbi:MAG: type III pantothenate kinase [Planctomycetes bacterium]|nr:type III pantothenate kinase [Planctomycetota bacterium]
MPELDTSLIAVDIGNSRIKLGRFDRGGRGATASPARRIGASQIPDPSETLDLPVHDHSGSFEVPQLAAWCARYVASRSLWLVASVHRGAANSFTSTVSDLAERTASQWPLRQITYRDLPLPILVEEPQRVGIDRLLAALAADRLRQRDRAAIIVDSGSAITVDLVDAVGAFRGGAILPGIEMAARALEEQTDALPRVTMADSAQRPKPLGKSTVAAIESGLYWGAVGAIRELVHQLSADLEATPDLFFTGGASPHLAKSVATNEPWSVRHVPHLVLAGLALVDEKT